MNADPESTSGFTLIELLAVIAIVTVLAALSLAGLSSAKSHARLAQCRSNLRQHGLALSQFVNDVHTYPLITSTWYLQGRFVEHRTSWVAALFADRMGIDFPHLYKDTGKGVLHCPSVGMKPPQFAKNRAYASYGYNAMGIMDRQDLSWRGLGGKGIVINDFAGLFPVEESLVVAPSAMLGIGDGLVGWDGEIADGSMSLDRAKPTYPTDLKLSTIRVTRRHNGKANIVFCDGHVSSLTLETLFKQRDAPSLRLWNRDNLDHGEDMAR